MQPSGPVASASLPLPWWLAGAIRVLLLVEGVGWWALLIVAVPQGGLVFYYGGFLAVLLLVGPALLVGIPAIVVALRPGSLADRRRNPGFLVLNGLSAIVGGALAFLQPDPVWYYALIATASAGAMLLLVVNVVRLPATVAAGAIGATGLALAYAASYALPPTVPPAPALHFRGVLIYPTSASGTVTPEPAGQALQQGMWTTATVNPGTYRYALACNGDWDHPSWETVQVPWGAVVRAPVQCPPPGTVTGYASWIPCQAAPGLNCSQRPFTRQTILFQTSYGGVFGATTDDAGSYTIRLPPGSYTIRSDFGYVVIGGQREVTVQSAGTNNIDLIFRPAF
jgi:hypothetical protein